MNIMHLFHSKRSLMARASDAEHKRWEARHQKEMKELERSLTDKFQDELDLKDTQIRRLEMLNDDLDSQIRSMQRFHDMTIKRAVANESIVTELDGNMLSLLTRFGEIYQSIKMVHKRTTDHAKVCRSEDQQFERYKLSV